MAAPGSGCHSHPIVYIPDLPDRVMEHLLAFMYCGETTVPTHLLLPLIEAAKLLGIQGLTEPNNIEGLVEEVTTANIPAKVEDEQNNTELAMTNGNLGKFRGLEQMVAQEPKRERQEVAQQEMAKPDSSNSLVFPALPPGMPRLSLASPMALGLASGHLGSGHLASGHLGSGHLASGHLGLPGLDSLHQLGLAQGVRRKSSPKLTSPNSTIASSSQVNSSSGVNYPHYPPTEDPTRPFACAQCPKRFRMKHHLKEHTLIHSGEMPFSCHLCPKRFNRSYTLKNHMKLHSAGSLVPGIKFDVPDIKFDVPGIKFQQVNYLHLAQF